MPTLEATLNRLAVTFTVRDIMTVNPDLVCGADKSEAARKSAAHPDFDVIPIKRDGSITGYFERKIRRSKTIRPSDLISDGTSVLDLVEILELRQFAFVLSREKIEGYIHFSDLNHQLVKLSFYVVLESVERMALNSLRGRDDPESLKKDLPPDRFEQIEDAYKRTGQAARTLVSYLNLSDMLRLAVKAGSLQIDDDLIKAMKNVRDGAAHVSKNLVSNYADVAKLGSVKRECLRILGTAW